MWIAWRTPVTDDDLHELPPPHRALARQLRNALRESERMDPSLAHRLARARAHAVAQGKDGGVPGWLWAPGSVAAAVVAALLVMHLGMPQSGQRPSGGATAEALEVLTDETDLEMYEDLELYRWLAQENGADA